MSCWSSARFSQGRRRDLAWLRVVAVGLFIISSFWTTVTLAWALLEAGARAEGDACAHFKALCLTCFIAMILPALLVVIFGGWSLLGLAGIILLTPMDRKSTRLNSS